MILKQKLNYSWNRKHKYNVMYVISDSRLSMAEACVYLCHQCTHWWLRWIRVACLYMTNWLIQCEDVIVWRVGHVTSWLWRVDYMTSWPCDKLDMWRVDWIPMAYMAPPG